MFPMNAWQQHAYRERAILCWTLAAGALMSGIGGLVAFARVLEIAPAHRTGEACSRTARTATTAVWSPS
jgi:hypothetical protein